MVLGLREYRVGSLQYKRYPALAQRCLSSPIKVPIAAALVEIPLELELAQCVGLSLLTSLLLLDDLLNRFSPMILSSLPICCAERPSKSACGESAISRTGVSPPPPSDR
jgi:hypothetical protein